jgi:transposase
MLAPVSGKEASMLVHVRAVGDEARLVELIRRARHAKPRDRLRAVLLAVRGGAAPQIARQLGRSRRFVQDWVYRYRDGGLEALHERPRPGQPTKLARAAEPAFRARLEAGPRAADGVCTLRGRDLQRILRQEFGAPYSLQGVYDLLHRLGYACLKPRPRHRKNDPAAMQEWLKRAPLLSGVCGPPTPGSGSKSGSKTKAASGSRAR